MAITVGGQVAREYCERFPRTASRTLARKMFTGNPFHSIIEWRVV